MRNVILVSILRIQLFCCLILFGGLPAISAPAVHIAQSAAGSPFQVREDQGQLEIVWPIDDDNKGQVQLSLTKPERLIRAIKIRSDTTSTILKDSSPVWQLLVGQRIPNKAGIYTFFDRVDDRRYDEFPLRLEIESVHVEIQKSRLQVRFSKLSGERFSGELLFTFFARSPLIHLEAIVSTTEKDRAILYRSGLRAQPDQVVNLTYHQAGGSPQALPPKQIVNYQAVKQIKFPRNKGLGRPGFDPKNSPLIGRAKNGLLQARYRSVVLQTAKGAVGLFPPPHKFLPPLDFAENVGFNFAWKKDGAVEAGIRQPPMGDGRYRPWVDCPAGSRQRLDLFLLISDQSADDCLQKVAAYTNGDRYPKLDGYHTFSSHYHMWHTRELIMEQRKRKTAAIPDRFQRPMFVKRFKEVGMDIVHLAEFHGGPRTGLSRYEELEVLHRECARLSDDEILILPGEEPNVHLGGHWISFFPKPVYWDWPDRKSKQRRKEQMVNDEFPEFERTDPKLGTVYFVDTAEEMHRLAEKEKALVWTAHPRIKGSTGYPDLYRDQAHYQSSTFLGAAWKAMPANYADDRLGRRVLDLLDDMNQWGEHKQILAEADLFQLNAASELFGHANINYLKLNAVPRYEDGWTPVLEALRNRQYFSGTGEILIRSLTYDGKEFPSVIRATDAKAVKIIADLQWTFPLSFAEIISGDGKSVFRDRIDLSHTGTFGEETIINRTLDLSDRKWLRFEVWDVAENGAFTQTVRIR